MADDEEDDGKVPDYQIDLIENALIQAGPDGLDKGALQEEVGLGTTDLRAALEVAQAEGIIVIDGDRFRPGPSAGVGGGRPDEAAAAADEMAEEPGAAEEDDEAAEGPGASTGASEERSTAEGQRQTGAPHQLRTRVAIDVMWYPEDAKEARDRGAMVVSKQLLEAAQRGVREAYPALAVSGAVQSVEVIGPVRRIFPSGG